MTDANSLARPLGEPRNALERLSRMAEAAGRDDAFFRAVLDALPTAVYITDAGGLITYYNDAAVQLWGQRPVLGTTQWCGSWKLFNLDGSPLPHDQCPMALALRDGVVIRGAEVLAERPDGVRVPFAPYPTLLHDESGAVIGAVNMLIETSDRRRAEEATQRLAAIVDSSEDAIVSKDLDGIVTSWNAGAQRLFGYTPEEAVGRSIVMIIPLDRRDEETSIISRIRRGERVPHYETLRRRKDGSLVEISLTVSPVRDAAGRIIGASKIARDITERRRAQERQELLLREMDHRIKNLFALTSGIVSLSARSADNPEELATAIRARLNALARAHALTLAKPGGEGGQTAQPTTLHTLVRTIAAAYDGTKDGQARVAVSGADVPITGSTVTNLALLLHEFTTNAAKYGALSRPAGRVEILCEEEGDRFLLTWSERGGPRVAQEPGSEGFGSLIARATVQRQFGGEIEREWRPEGLTIRLSVARDRLTA